MNAGPPGSARFAVWSPEDVKRWADGAKEQPMGQGAPSRQYGGDQVWVGNPRLSGIYYVVVDQQGPVPSTYTLSIDTAYR
jgi:hypothetical protein